MRTARQTEIPILEPEEGRPSRLRLFLRDPANGFAAIIIGLLVLAAIFPHGLLPHDPTLVDITNRFAPPVWLDGGSSSYLLGTDQLGRDLFSRLVFASRYILLVATLSVVIAGLLGGVAGLVAGYVGGWVDSVVGRLVDVQLAFPPILLLMALVAVVGLNLMNLILVLGITGWAGFARVVRGSVLAVREHEYVLAAQAIGVGEGRILWRHILPNVATSLNVFTTFEFARLILLESALSFLGLGIQPPRTSWGAMISDGRNYMFDAWWVSVLPGIVLVFAILAINLFGDGLRDVLDPQTSRR